MHVKRHKRSRPNGVAKTRQCSGIQLDMQVALTGGEKSFRERDDTLYQRTGNPALCPTPVSGSALHPLRAAILGIDTAAISGAAIRVRGRLVMSCQVDTKHPEQVTEVVTYLGRVAARERLPMAVALERPWGGSTAVLIGLGAARERWMSALKRAGVPARRIVSVMPQTWRRAVFGKRWARAKRAEIRAHELATARAVTQRDAIGPDEAAAIWISYWASYAPAISDRIHTSL